MWIGLAFASAAQASVMTELQPRDIGLPTARNALVIGNSSYSNITSLPNPANDANAISKALAQVGFHVFQAIDVNRSDMSDVIGRFLNSVTPGSEALVYYAGHGVEMDGQNYLLPTDIRKLDPTQQYALRTDGVSLTTLLQDLETRTPRVSLVILDACRNNPFERQGTRSLGNAAGLGRVDPPQGTLVLYAAAAGEMALDSLGQQDTDPNGLFTRNLLRLITQPGLEIRPMVQELKDRVYEAALSQAQHTQRPSYYDGLIGKFYFLPEREVKSFDPCVMAVKRDISDEELMFADPSSAVTICTESAQRDPGTGLYKELLVVAEEQRAAQKALVSDNPVYSVAYLKLYPTGRFTSAVRVRLASLGELPVTPQPQPLPQPPPQPQPQPEPVIPSPSPVIDLAALSRDVQTELNRVGCSAGKPDGVWGNRSERALEQFLRHRGITLASLEPTPELLQELSTAPAQVCPVSCSVTQREQNGVCVAKTCPSGQQLSSKGSCYVPKEPKRADKTKPPQNQPKPKPTSSCFVFNGQTYCE